MSENEKMYAYIFASKTCPGAVPLLDLKKGDVFSWPHGGANYTYSGKGWYKNEKKQSFRANVKTAVIRKS